MQCDSLCNPLTHGVVVRMQGLHHPAEAEEGPAPGCCCGAYSERVAAAPGQEERPAAHPQDAASKGRPLSAAARQPGQVVPSAIIMP